MAYSIKYGPPIRQERRQRKKEGFRALILGCLILLVLLNILGFGERIIDRLIPFDRMEVAGAFAQMEQDLQQGSAMPEVIRNFLNLLIHDGDPQSN